MNHIEGREAILESLRRELVGPSPAGMPLDFANTPTFAEASEAYGPWVQEGSGEEILQRDPPSRRYGVGVLFPVRARQGLSIDEEGTAEDADGSDEPVGAEQLVDASAVSALREIGRRSRRMEDDQELDLSSVNDYHPSAMAVSFLAEVREDTRLSVRVAGGRYVSTVVRVAGNDRVWWLRRPVHVEARFDGRDMVGGARRVVAPRECTVQEEGGPRVVIQAFVRPTDDGTSLITVSAANSASVAGLVREDSLALFQAHLSVIVDGPDGDARIVPYPRAEPAGDAAADDDDESSFELLYHKALTFAVGHGCAANWDAQWGADRASRVTGESLPVYEAPSITPEVQGRDGATLRVSMAALAGINQQDDGSRWLESVVNAYAEWIDSQDAASVPPRHRPAARMHVAACRRALGRMRDGLEFLRADPLARRAFELANHSVLRQQLRTRNTSRPTRIDPRTGMFVLDEAFQEGDWRTESERGYWRPFQIAFLLATIRSIANGHDVDRDVVELMFFPTGGGKTEAYLGQTAFAIFYRRLIDPSNDGVAVLMRYTLRLLTAQQFLRAAALICAMEDLRKQSPDLGEAPFSIGIWLGGSTTPNLRADARAKLSALNRGERNATNPFLLLRCPWCAAQMGPIDIGRRRAPLRVAGYRREGSTVVMACPDATCSFSPGLPIYVIDEDIYSVRPSLVIGTVDKFALLAWRPEARALFGLGADGIRNSSPPGLIIQDELHLISGPLGSMVGLYEAVVEDLATDYRMEPPVRPKIVASTATIRRYRSQIQGLYGRQRAELFPPHGLDASDSFFGRYAIREDGSAWAPGRMYVGVNAPGLGSVQTAQVRTFSALLQGAADLPEEARDPWHTLMAFFNSLRELGTSLSLLQSDIPDYLGVLRNRGGLDWSRVRRINDIIELTSRLGDSDVPDAIERLQRPYDRGAVDVCLASSIIEVGIDIDRLSLICLLGQPKSTSQYIQVTGRIGRRWWERPGLAVVVYSASKPRDRSHFERFRTYHERLYAQVEPTSVTPFAAPVLNRALHAALVAHVRQTGPSSLRPWPIPEELVTRARHVLLQRVSQVDPAERESFEQIMEDRIAEWTYWERTDWSAASWSGDAQVPLMRAAGEWAPPAAARMSWQTPLSLRNVDAECRAEVTSYYAIEAAAGHD